MANTKVTGDLIASSTIATGNIADNAVTSDKISGITTAHITEGSNLYYTDARARGAVSVSGNALAYNSSTGVITSNFEESPAFTGNVDVAGNITVGGNDSILAENNLRFKSSGAAYIDHNTAGQAINFRTSNSSSLDTNAMTILGSGGVGIGTTSPAEKLEVSGGHIKITNAGNTNLYINANASNADATIFFEESDSVKAKIQHDASNDSMLFTDGAYTNTMTLKGGKVGIGTTSPSQLLHVNSATSNATGIGLQNSERYYSVRSNNFSLVFTDETVGSERMRIDSSGNLGIGTTSPAAKLHVENTNAAIVYVKSTVNNQNASIFFNSNSGGTQADRWEIGTNISAGSDLEFFDRLNSVSRMVIQNDGNVGIGTTSPGAKLHNYSTATQNVWISGHGTLAQNNWGAGHAIFAAQDNGLLISKANASNNTNRLFSFYHDSGGNSEFYMYDTNSNNKVKIDSSGDTFFNGGNVGIGITSPQKNLQIFQTEGGVGAKHATIRLGGYSTVGPDIAAYRVTGNSNDQGLIFSTYDATNGTVDTMWLTNTGKVGIGVDPSGNTDILQIDNPANPTSIRIGDNTTDDCYVVFNTDGNDWSIGTDRSDGNKFKISDYSRVGTNDNFIMNAAGHTTFKGDTVSISPRSGGNAALEVTRTSGANVFIQSQSSLGVFGVATNNDLDLKTNDATRIRIKNSGNVGIGETSPETRLQVRGALGVGPAIADSNIAYSSTGFSHQDGGALHMNYSLGGTASSGDTITFTYAATVWKSWSLKYNFASTSGITQGVVGGYWNNSGGSSNHTETNDHGVSVAVTHSGQGNTVTFTFTNLGTHPMAHFVYMQGGGDGQPRADRVTLTGTS